MFTVLDLEECRWKLNFEMYVFIVAVCLFLTSGSLKIFALSELSSGIWHLYFSCFTKMTSVLYWNRNPSWRKFYFMSKQRIIIWQPWFTYQIQLFKTMLFWNSDHLLFCKKKVYQSQLCWKGWTALLSNQQCRPEGRGSSFELDVVILNVPFSCWI